jgi:hypothetical protein
MTPKVIRVGRVLRASTRDFAIGCAVMQPDIPAFGSFVRADGLAPDSAIYGLIYDVSMEDDPLVRQIVSADPPEEVVRDQRRNRQIPIEVSVLSVGCKNAERIRHCLPPQPPVTLDWLYQCTAEEIQAFITNGRRYVFDYFRLALDARETPVDELLVASLQAAAASQAENERERFLIEAGRELVRLLSGDPVRLEGLLRRLSRL